MFHIYHEFNSHHWLDDFEIALSEINMIFIKYSILLLLIFSDSTTCNNKTSEEIMNGHFAELGEFPYMVRS